MRGGKNDNVEVSMATKGSKSKNAGQVHACLPVPGCLYLPASRIASVGIRCWTGSK
jgi:hypothetical protein